MELELWLKRDIQDVFPTIAKAIILAVWQAEHPDERLDIDVQLDNGKVTVKWDVTPFDELRTSEGRGIQDDNGRWTFRLYDQENGQTVFEANTDTYKPRTQQC